jgi:Fe-S-cluster containining protein
MHEALPSRRLPVLPGAHHLTFRCNGCGDCCRAVRVAITHHDLRRLALGVVRPAASFVQWLAPDEVDMTNEPGSFVELPAGRRLMVLAQRDGACHLLDPSQRCSAYAHRPLDCQIYPFDIARDDAGAIVGLERLDPDACGEQGPRIELAELGARDEQRWSELREYQSHVARWNRLAGHRRRFRKRPGDASEFLAFLGLAATPLERGGAAGV